MSDQMDLFGGEKRKRDGINRVSGNNAVWMNMVIPVIRKLASTGSSFTSEDVRVECGKQQIPRPSHPNAWGAAFNTASKRNIIERIGNDKNHLASAHARIVGVWRRKDV